jgi:heme A synthase
MAFLALVFGALTANVAGANNSCRGFPWCTSIEVHGVPLSIQIVHRVLAFVLLLHTFGMIMAARKRGEPVLIQRSIRLAFAAVVVQIFVAATLVELHLPAVWRSIHQAMGTVVWLAIFTLTALARYTMIGADREGLGVRSEVPRFDSAVAR